MTTDKATFFEIENEFIQLKLTNVGASVVDLKVKDKQNNWQDVVLGFEKPESYLTENAGSLGSIVGRHANRIKDGRFTLENKDYQLEKNSAGNNLHSGFNRYHTRLWKLEDKTDSKIKFSLFSPDGDQGFPGNLTITVTYTLKEESVVLKYTGISDEATLFNLTNHTYFNLNGHGKGNVLNHELKSPSCYFMPLDENSVPLGSKRSVENSAMDFLETKSIQEQFDFSDEQVAIGKGYDHYFFLDDLKDLVTIYSPETGIQMTSQTNLPGYQLYTANYLDNLKGKQGAVYQEQSAFCIETQYCPNGINIPGLNQSPVIEKDVLTEYETIWEFTIR